jgi:nitroreductase
MDAYSNYAVKHGRPVADAVADRYGETDEQIRTGNAVVDHMLMHRTIRRFTSEQVAEADIKTAIAAAQSAATSSNLQSWSVIKVTDPAHKREVNRLCGNQGQIEEAPLMLVWLADQSRNYAIGQAYDTPLEAFDYFESMMLGTVDTCIAAQNAALAFEALGYGTCFIGAVRNNAAILASLLKLPQRCAPVTGLVIGRPHPTQDTDIKPRLSQNVVVHEEIYRMAGRQEISDYDYVMSRFQDKQGMAPVGWSSAVAARLGTKGVLHGRDRYMEFLRAAKMGIR